MYCITLYCPAHQKEKSQHHLLLRRRKRARRRQAAHRPPDLPGHRGKCCPAGAGSHCTAAAVGHHRRVWPARRSVAGSGEVGLFRHFGVFCPWSKVLSCQFSAQHEIAISRTPSRLFERLESRVGIFPESEEVFGAGDCPDTDFIPICAIRCSRLQGDARYDVKF